MSKNRSLPLPLPGHPLGHSWCDYRWKAAETVSSLLCNTSKAFCNRRRINSCKLQSTPHDRFVGTRRQSHSHRCFSQQVDLNSYVRRTLCGTSACYVNNPPPTTTTTPHTHSGLSEKPVWWEMYLSIIHLRGTKEVSVVLLVSLLSWVASQSDCQPKNGWMGAEITSIDKWIDVGFLKFSFLVLIHLYCLLSWVMNTGHRGAAEGSH